MPKSIVEVDVQDASFQKFYQHFLKYKQATDQLPATWGKIGKATKEASEQAQKGFQAEAHAIAMMTASLSQVVKLQGTMQKNAVNSTGIFRDIVKQTGEIAKNITSTTFQLAKWAAFGGLAGVATGFFGASSLAGSASNLRNQAQRTNVSPGQLRSARNNIGIHGIDTDALFGNLNVMQQDIIGRGYLANMGITGDQLDQSPGNLLTTIIPKIIQMTNQMGGSPQAYNSMHFNELMDYQSYLQLKRMNPAELSGMMSDYTRDSSKLDIGDDTLKNAQKLATAFAEATDKIENVFIKGVVKYAPQIEAASEKIVEGFGKVLAWINASPADRMGQIPLMQKPNEAALAANPKVQQGTSGIPWLDRMFGKNNSWLHPGAAASLSAPENPLLSSIYGIESSFGTDPRARNPNAKYRGPFQVGSSVIDKYNITDPMSYEGAAPGVSRFLDDLSKKYGGDVHKIIASYNEGETTMDKIFKAHPGDWEKYAPAQAQDYISKFDKLNANNSALLGAYAGGNPSLSPGGMRIILENRTGADINVTASQLGAQ